MRSVIPLLLAVALQACLVASRTLATGPDGEIRPPFGLVWGLESQLVEESLRTTGGHVVERTPGPTGGERWIVEGIAQDGLQRVLFTFTDGHLDGVELQYGKDDWDAQTFDEFMRKVRVGLDAEFGRSHLLVRQRTPAPGVMKTLLGYAWSGDGRSVSLIYFSAQDERNLFRLVSIHYSARPPRTAPRTASRY